MSAEIRWGIVGAGMIARRFVTDIALCRDSRLAGIASRALDRAEALRDFAGVAPEACLCFQGYDDMLASPEIDAIYIALPTALHAEATLAAIAHGKPVLCEKPLAMNASQVDAIAKAAKEAGVPVMEAVWTRTLPNVLELRRRLDAGEIGMPLHLNATLGFPVDDSPHKSVAEPSLGGGVIRDLGVYPISLAQFFLGDLSYCASEVRYSARGTDRDMSAVLRGGAQGSCLVTLSASHSGQLPNRLEITGTKGRLSLDAPFLCGLGGRITHFPEVKESAEAPVTAEPATSTPSPAPPRTRGLKDKLKQSSVGRVLRRFFLDRLRLDGTQIGSVYEGSGLQFQIDEFSRMLHRGERECQLMRLSDSLAAAQLLDRISEGKTLGSLHGLNGAQAPTLTAMPSE
ncbi:Gfo/Idh/MocA family protein [Celeribacter naphthalenivorans]|uniref:Gfo/Idh/MocA family protein n=1 Tax=Celeribacter naphthalenivorans TaxID=1614694 RepID=UPI001CF96155|nr:Gfo/Idh/MocA family oxidoreductase [Celeribacter naphthalenivorans]